MPRLRTLTPHDYRVAEATSVAAPRAVRHTQTPRSDLHQASRMPNPPKWLAEMDLTANGERRAARLRELEDYLNIGAEARAKAHATRTAELYGNVDQTVTVTHATWFCGCGNCPTEAD